MLHATLYTASELHATPLAIYHRRVAMLDLLRLDLLLLPSSKDPWGPLRRFAGAGCGRLMRFCVVAF